jgi:predicted dehydrogenase
MKKVRIGVIGVGYLGKFHAEKYARMNDVHLVGIVDTNHSQADKIASKFNTLAYYDHRKLMAKVDAVSIAVPTSEHFSVSRDFLENDIDVLIEKPITTTLEEADTLIQIAKSRGLIIQVGQLERFNPAIAALQDQDVVKKPMFIEAHRLSIYRGRCTDVSVVLDLMIHDIDIILSFVKSGVQEIHASGIPVISNHVDIANARLSFETGCVANITASRISAKNERKIRLFQKDAYVSVDFANHDITLIRKRDDHPDGIFPGADIQQLSFSKGDALENELAAFVKAVAHRKLPEVTGQMGRDALKVALCILEQIHAANLRYVTS